MPGFWDKFFLPILTIVIGISLVLVGALTDLDGLYNLGLIILGSGLGLPLNGRWSAKEYLVE